jgi:hypothetical protein
MQKTVINIDVRRKIFSDKELKESLNHHGRLQASDDKRTSLAVGDILDFDYLPLLKPIKTRTDGLENQFSSSLFHSNIIQSFRQYEPRSVERMRAGIRSTTDTDNNQVLKEAINLIVEAKKSPQSVAMHFEAATIFDRLQIYDRAVTSYEKAAKNSLNSRLAETIVDKERLPDSEAHRRKLERLSKRQRDEYIRARDILRSEMVK